MGKKAFVIIHAENSYLDRKNVGEATVKENAEVFSKIESALKERVRNMQIYFLGQDSIFLDDTAIPTFIISYKRYLKYIPCTSTHEAQFLELKKHLIQNTVTLAELCGFARDMCIKDISYLLQGKSKRFPSKEHYAEANERHLKLPKEEFDILYSKHIPVKILEELTA